MFQMIQKVYGEEALDRAAAFKWWKHFKDDEPSVRNEPRSGCPSIIVTHENVQSEPLS